MFHLIIFMSIALRYSDHMLIVRNTKSSLLSSFSLSKLCGLAKASFLWNCLLSSICLSPCSTYLLIIYQSISMAFKQAVIKEESPCLWCQPWTLIRIRSSDSRLRHLKPLREIQQNKWFEANKNIKQLFPALHSHHIHLLYTKFAIVEFRATKPVSPISGFLFFIFWQWLLSLQLSFPKYLNIWQASVLLLTTTLNDLMMIWIFLLFFKNILR